MKKALENINGLFWLYKPYFKYGKFFALASEIGTHNELMLKKGKYYEMFVKQAENYVI